VLVLLFYFIFFSFSKKYHFLVDTNVVSFNILLIIKNDIINKLNLVTDRRTYKDRRDVWASEKKKSEFVAERPKAKIKHNTPPPEENPLRKTKSGGGTRTKSEEQNEEDLVNFDKKNKIFSCFFF
jgi:hypothetical protein